jgi:hypothetical protein
VVGINHIFKRQANLKAIERLGPDHIAEWLNNRWDVRQFNENGAG